MKKVQKQINSILSGKEMLVLESAILKPGKKVSEQLLKSGILTPEVLQVLRQEFHSRMEKSIENVPKDQPSDQGHNDENETGPSPTPQNNNKTTKDSKHK